MATKRLRCTFNDNATLEELAENLKETERIILEKRKKVLSIKNHLFWIKYTLAF